MDKYITENSHSIDRIYESFSKILVKGVKDPSFNVSENVLDYFYKTIGKYGNHTARSIEGNLDRHYANFLALFQGIVSGLFEDDGIILKDYGNLIIKYLNVFNDIDIESDHYDAKIRPILMSTLNQLFTIPGEEVSLIDASYLYSLNNLIDFKNPSTAKKFGVWTWGSKLASKTATFERFNLIHFRFNEKLWIKDKAIGKYNPPPVHTSLKKSFYDCAHHYIDKMNLKYKSGEGYYDSIVVPQNTFENFSSPCKDLDEYEICSVYCKWHAKFIDDWEKEDFLTLMKFAIPQRKMLLKPSSLDKEINLAEKLFGPENIKILEHTTAPKFLVLFCHNPVKGYFGDNAGLSLKFCNDFFPTPTDVGICLTRNMDIKNILHENNIPKT